ncbi:MAG: CvpA family protein [Alphaproteobacteria bacterium]|nr:CvpA family protein [Alphaproteobacteria bacterium]
MLDLIVFAILFLSGVFAWYRGLVRELLGITSWIVAGIAALYGAPYVIPYVGNFFQNPSLVSILSAGITALFVLIIFAFFNTFISKMLHKSALSGLDRILGFAFGLLRGTLLVSISYFCFTLVLPEGSLSEFSKGSFSEKYIVESTNYLKHFIPQKEISKLKISAESIKETSKAFKERDKIPKEIRQEYPEYEGVSYEKEDQKALDSLIQKEL